VKIFEGILFLDVDFIYLFIYLFELLQADEVYLEAQVQNITAAPICLEKVDLEPSPSFNCSLNADLICNFQG